MNNNNKHSKKRKAAKGVDASLTEQGKGLAVGQSVRFRLIKGPSVTSSGDPVDSKAPWQYFPMIAKFGESVQRPDFARKPWQAARFYEQEVPKPEDSEEEDNAGEGEGAASAQAPKKKRWRYGDNEAPRQWIVQEDVDFYQTFIDRKEQKTTSSADKRARISSRYEGTNEHNPSQYGLIQLHHGTITNSGDNGDLEYLTPLQVCLLPSPQDTNATINFSQPAARKTYSLTEAEHVISDQRMGLIKSLHHMEPNAQNNASANGDGDKEGEGADAPPPPPRNILALRKKAANSTKGRLLNKLKQQSKAAANDNEEEEGDDIMGDIGFRVRKGGGAARKELLSAVGDNVMVSDDGVLGGANDAVFGGRQRFAQFQESAEDRQKEEGENAAAGQGDDEERGGAGAQQNKERGGDGAAMEDDFFQRDVKAEYDELDYDANEQFDDDDVDLGEAEQIIDTSGFRDDDLDDDDMDDDEDEDDDDLADGGVEGLASLAGFKALLAKARGETPPEGETPMVNKKSRYDNNKKKQQLDHMSKIIAADEKARLDAERRKARRGGGAVSMDSDNHAAATTAAAPEEDAAVAEEQPAAAPQPVARATDATANLMDANGMRIISLEAVRREIWLNHGSIPMKRLMKIFDVKKKSPQERQDKFREVVKELCTMQNDPVSGRMLILKQHYSK